MTASEIVSVITSSPKIDKNVFNFFDNYKEFELLLVKLHKPLTEGGNELLERDTLIEYIDDRTKPQYKKRNLLKIYDEVKWRMDWYSVSDIYTSTAQVFNCERYDLNNAKAVSENVVSVVDRTTGDTVYFAADQTNAIIEYNYEEKCEVLNYDTGEVTEEFINKGKDSLGTDKHRHSTWYRD